VVIGIAPAKFAVGAASRTRTAATVPGRYDPGRRPVEGDAAQQARHVAAQRGHVDADVGQQPGHALAQQQFVISDHDAHGNSTRMQHLDGLPGSTDTVPFSDPTRSSMATRSGGGVRVWMCTRSTPSRRVAVTEDGAHQAMHDGVVRGGLHRPGRAVGDRGRHAHRRWPGLLQGLLR
jgi:hypothetical protein